MTMAEPHPLLSPPGDAMKRRAVRGAIATSTSQGVKLLVQFGSVIILARLLDPRDFGIFAMVTPIIGFATLFQDFGLTQAMVTARNLSQGQAATMFRINLALSISVACLLALTAPLIGLFYGENAVIGIAMAMAFQIVLAGCTASHLALLSRAMQFHKLAALDICATLSGFAAALTVAILAPSPWALAAQTLTAAAVMLIGAWIVTGWRPIGRAAPGEVKPMLRFGGGMTSFNLTNYLSRNADNVLIGWAHGAVQLGLYDRAYKLLLFPLTQVNAPISNVMVPILSRLRDEPERYRSAYIRTLQQMLLVTVPGVAFLVATADRLIPTLMGANWAPAVPIFMWLGLAAIHQTVSNTFGWLFVSQQRTGEYARFGLFSAVTCIGAFVVGLPWGAEGVAAAYGISGIVIRLPAIILVVGRSGPVRGGDIVRLFSPYLLATGIAAAAWAAAHAWLPASALLYLCSSAILIYSVAWAVLMAMPSGRAAFGEAIKLLPIRRGRAS